MRSHVSVKKKEQYGESSAEFESAIILNIFLESEETLCPLTHKNCTFVTQSSHIENSFFFSFQSAVLVDRRAFLVQLNKIS